MRKIALAMSLILMFALNGTITVAQVTSSTFDTIKIIEGEYNQFDFTIQDTLIETLDIYTEKAVQLKEVHFKIGSGIFGNIVTATTGIGVSGYRETDFYLASALHTNNPNLEWRYDIYCPGYVEKNRERVTNSNGNTSVETTYSNVISWEKRALGYIIEGKDTIGWNYVYLEPRTDSVLQKWSPLVFNYKPGPVHCSFREFGLQGAFTGIETGIIYNSEEERIYLIRNDTIMGIYQCQKPPKMAIKKKNRVFYQPYLLVDKNLTAWERMDVLRLEMIGLRLRRVITLGY